MQNQDQAENLQLIHQDVHTIELDQPIMMGELEISKLEIRKPNVQALQGIKIADLLQGDVTSICTILPRICTPNLTKTQVIQLDPADISQIGGAIMLFLQPKSVRAQVLLQQ